MILNPVPLKLSPHLIISINPPPPPPYPSNGLEISKPPGGLNRGFTVSSVLLKKLAPKLLGKDIPNIHIIYSGKHKFN